jgi:hypothetical protein
MSMHAKTKEMLDYAVKVLTAHNPMTVRQVYYQLVSGQVIENNRSQYGAVSKLLVEARKDETIPWEWIEDRIRKPREVSMWENMSEFVEGVQQAYRSNVWATQETYIECWLEKDALSGIVEDVIEPYGITLNVGRGFDGWSSIYDASKRYEDIDKPTAILYLGDFDPSGEDMVRSLKQRLGELGSRPAIIKLALTNEDVIKYNLPSDIPKASDTRSKAFIDKYGKRCVELDALPVETLREHIKTAIDSIMDLSELEKVLAQDKVERQRLITTLTA